MVDDRADQFDCPAMIVNDAIAYRQSKAGALANRLGGKKRIENPGEIFRRDAMAGIPHLDDNRCPLPRPVGSQKEFTTAAVPHGVVGITDQIDQNLAEFFRVANNCRQIRLRLDMDSDAAESQGVAR